MPTPLQATEAGNILKFQVFSNKVSKSADLSAGVVVCDYYESILDNTVRFSIIVVDSGNDQSNSQSSVTVLQELKLSGSEKVHLTIEDKYGNKLKFEGDNALYIGEIRNIISSSERIIYTIDLVSREFIANDLLGCEVYRRYDGKISDSASSILKDILKTKKSLIIDETINKFNFIGQGKKPFRLLAEIATRGVSAASKNSAGYLIYENYNGYNFRSIDSLFNEEPYKSYIYNSSTKLPNGYDSKIIKYDGDNSMNVEKTLKSGGYGAKLETFNTYTHIFKPTQEIETDEQNIRGGLEVPKLADDFQEYASKGVLASKRFSKRDSAGELPTGSVSEQIKKATESNLKLEEVICQSAMTYNKLFSLEMYVVVPGDYSLRAGDLIHCDFPEQSGKINKTMDKELSGVYIIADICTHLTPKTTLTKMRLVRDSHGRKANKTGATQSSNNTNSPNGLFGNPLNALNLNQFARKFTENTDLASIWNNPEYSSNRTTEDNPRVIDRSSQTSSVDVNTAFSEDFNASDYLNL